MSSISLKNVTVDIPVFDADNKSLRAEIAQVATGGVLLKNRPTTIVRALEEVSFELKDGDRLGLFGHNGSGKSTLLRVLLGTYPTTFGEAKTNGDVQAILTIGSGLDWSLTGRDNIIRLLLLKNPRQKIIKENIEKIIEFSGLQEFIDLPIRIYSSGMMLRLCFAIFINKNPDILLLDEFISAGDEDFSKKSIGLMDQYIKNCKILVLASHSQDTIRKHCNRVAIMEKGHFTEIDASKF